MKKMKNFLCMMLVFMLIVTMFPVNADAASKIKINKTKTTIYVGQTITLKASGAKNVKWSSSNKKVATVSSKGKVTAKKKGNATITIKVGKKKATCKVTVKKPFLNMTSISLKKNETATLKLTGAKVKAWSSNNKKVATVSSKGKITANESGVATITCKDKNNKKYTCMITVTEEHTHQYTSQITTKATCTTDGVITYTCACGYSYTETIPKTGHKASNWIVDKEATCTEDGSKHKECTICGETLQTESIAKTNHTFGKAVVTREATCTENGEKNIKCTKCGYAKYEEVPATGHKASDWIIDKEATCTEPGNRHTECTVCHQTLKTEEIQTNHAYDNGKVTQEPTCSSEGVKTYTCTKCGDIKTESIEATGHIYDEGKITKEATCQETGEKTFTCTKCGDTKKETIEKVDHTSSDWIIDKEATCIANGSRHKECTVCGETLETESIEATGHTMVNGVCSKCGYKKEETHTHKYTIEVTEPTCVIQGYTTYTCACGDSYTKDFTDALGHDISDWQVTKEPTCTEDGLQQKICTRCKEVKDVMVISATGHKYGEVQTIEEPTCTKDGYGTKVCSECGDTVQTTLSATGHTYGEFVETVAPADFETFGTADMVCPKCKEKIFTDLTAVKVDLGNGNSTTMYGYYDYDEAKKCFDLTYKYKEENGFLSDKAKYRWDDKIYNYACIRVAEMAYQFDTTFDASHEKPNGVDLKYGENLTYKGKFEGGNCNILVSYTANDAFQAWMNSRGHKENIEDYMGATALAQFTAWIPEWESWCIFWVQDFH